MLGNLWVVGGGSSLEGLEGERISRLVPACAVHAVHAVRAVQGVLWDPPTMEPLLTADSPVTLEALGMLRTIYTINQVSRGYIACLIPQGEGKLSSSMLP